jgi:hypothetical protein
MADMFYWIYNPDEKELEFPISFNSHKQISDIRHIGLEEFLKSMPEKVKESIQRALDETGETGTQKQLEFQLKNEANILENWILKLRLNGDSKKIIGLNIRK